MATPTDDELREIGRRAYGIRPADYKNKLEGLAAERRALYEAGRKAGYSKGWDDAMTWSRGGTVVDRGDG